jgi:ABC-type oligopeptide transport system substrate-binding subunit
MNQFLQKKAFILRGPLFQISIIGIAIFIALFAQSCGNNADDSAAGKKVFRYNQTTPVSSLDPAFARNQTNMWAIQNLYDCLVDVDDSVENSALFGEELDDFGRWFDLYF